MKRPASKYVVIAGRNSRGDTLTIRIHLTHDRGQYENCVNAQARTSSATHTLADRIAQACLALPGQYSFHLSDLKFSGKGRR